MIQIDRPPPPAVLTPGFIANGVARFIQDGSSAWNTDEIKAALSEMSGSKCAYCELRLGEGAAYLEVDHFFAKSHHPHRVLEWGNLLPSCRRCNGRKGDWDVAVPGQMIVDPVQMAPANHIRLDEAYRPVGLTPEGENSILELGLDDIHRLGVMRYRLGESFKRKLEELHATYAALPVGATNRQRRSIMRKVQMALELCHRDQPFSAVVSTVLVRSIEYSALKFAMTTAGDWNDQLQQHHDAAEMSSLA